MITFTYEGKEYEFRGEYRDVVDGDLWLNKVGHVAGPYTTTTSLPRVRAIVHPVSVRHTFGGVVWEEDGEPRLCRKGEWVWWEERVSSMSVDATFPKYQPVHPVDMA